MITIGPKQDDGKMKQFTRKYKSWLLVSSPQLRATF